MGVLGVLLGSRGSGRVWGGVGRAQAGSGGVLEGPLETFLLLRSEFVNRLMQYRWFQFWEARVLEIDEVKTNPVPSGFEEFLFRMLGIVVSTLR